MKSKAPRGDRKTDSGRTAAVTVREHRSDAPWTRRALRLRTFLVHALPLRPQHRRAS
ncbi:MAG: hypothetical protein HZA93_08985 [Verrucomicrobia bacterium]|nr:hypothetical protein [Verrucomicrobiota bacterium]